jgi:YggT family protein
MVFIVLVIKSLVVVAWVVVLLRVLLSWIDPQFHKPFSRYVYNLTEPVLAPIRNFLPKTGMLDLSPLVLLLGLGFLMRVVVAV